MSLPDIERNNTMRNRVKVFMTNGSMRHLLDVFFTYEEALRFCRSFNWYWVDENSFCWDLEIEE
jgi:hypothetical protein